MLFFCCSVYTIKCSFKNIYFILKNIKVELWIIFCLLQKIRAEVSALKL